MNVQGLIAGSTDTPLTDEGRKQARKAGKLAKLYNIDLIVASPLVRAAETAEIIAKEIGYDPEKILHNKLLVERDHGSLEGKAWSPDLNMDGFSDIETDNTLLERAHLALKWLDNLEADYILLVSHGTFGRALRSIIREEYTMDHHDGLNNAEIHQWL
ncbi:hypothetical protein BH23PAT2_BH23PAT2_02740 [soil metagenome]